jgi:hypothetical protein
VATAAPRWTLSEREDLQETSFFEDRSARPPEPQSLQKPLQKGWIIQQLRTTVF